MGPPELLDHRRRRRIHSINFDDHDGEWIDGLVALLAETGYQKAGRSEVVRIALFGLREALAGRTPMEIVRFFLDRDSERLMAAFEGTPKLPFS